MAVVASAWIMYRLDARPFTAGGPGNVPWNSLPTWCKSACLLKTCDLLQYSRRKHPTMVHRGAVFGPGPTAMLG
ncbi:hypothetical protein PHLCEN_2v1451 [Hermanssonia centrifuga]|uniref:Uncharacterized protein n=1 Tax=Hermanssonia centrifuga TaxID=98765 RepID=A0A2R6RZX4_9APHY|nr:hypothetical protein PHLCEN_2v1451 [Hermanssonia centrifuga]